MVSHQLFNRADAGQEQLAREHLRLVKDQHAVCNVVQLSAARGAVGIERLEELHVGGHDDRRIPVFARERARIRLLILAGIVVDIVMVLQHVLCAERIAKDRRRLVDDGCIGDDVDHAAKAVLQRVLERKGEGGERLPAAGWHREGKQSAWKLRRAEAVPLHLASLFGDVVLWRAEA